MRAPFGLPRKLRRLVEDLMLSRWSNEMESPSRGGNARRHSHSIQYRFDVLDLNAIAKKE